MCWRAAARVALISGGKALPPANPLGADGVRRPLPIIPRPKRQTIVPMPYPAGPKQVGEPGAVELLEPPHWIPINPGRLTPATEPPVDTR